jgi:hypothetical protein
MKQTELYLWYPLFHAQWDRCDQQNHQPKYGGMHLRYLTAHTDTLLSSPVDQLKQLHSFRRFPVTKPEFKICYNNSNFTIRSK